MRYKVKNISGKRVSFDFDGTLADDFDDTINSQKDEVQDICRQLIEMGNQVYLITKRYSPVNSSLGKMNEHLEVFDMASKLNIPKENVVFTDRELKAETLIKMNIDLHFENSDFELNYLNTFKNNVNMVLITDSYWRDIVY
jgi:hypothetical protein